MEEWIGERWHRAITAAAATTHPHAAVRLEAVQRSAELVFRAAGGGAAVRVVPAGLASTGGPRGWLQRLAGSGTRHAIGRLDADTLALPPVVDVFDDAALNRGLLVWLAALAGAQGGEGAGDGPGGWIGRNARATARTLAACPGLAPSWDRLREAHLAQRPDPARLRGAAAEAERAVRRALDIRAGSPDAGAASHDAACWTAADVAPVWLWLDQADASAAPPAAAAPPGAGGTEGAVDRAPQALSRTRRRTRRSEPGEASRPPLLLPSKNESLLSWGEHVPVDRATDDEADPNAVAAADDMERLAVQRSRSPVASRLRFDLDLPSAAADDVVLGEGESFPEWDGRRRRLVPDRVRVVSFAACPARAWQPPSALRAEARRVRRRLELLRAAPRWRRGCLDGEAIDLDAWVRHAGSRRAGGPAPEARVHARRSSAERSLASLLLADLSLSTDAHASDEQRVVDVIREALFVFGEALDGTGDTFSIAGFSSVKRSHVRLHHLKGFDEPWGAAARARVGAIQPGFYTRMGAAVRAGTARLAARPERQRLLLLLTDGKPHDIDGYEGGVALEDTRHAVDEARAAGVVPFCLSIDEDARAARDYLPLLFGRTGFAQLQRPSALSSALVRLYAALALHRS